MIRILFLSDTHIGFDWPQNPRIKRRRRGDDFWSNYLLALEPALKNQVDLVVHGGDLLFRNRVPGSLVVRALEPLIDIAESGIPVFVVPGNHERSNLRRTIFDFHPNLHFFHQPFSHHLKLQDQTISLTGFPFYRGNIRSEFSKIIMGLSDDKNYSGFRIICMHHPVDGAAVGPKNFTFINQADTIDIQQITSKFDLVLGGHIHRRQILRTDPAGKSLESPVIYAGSIERTSFAERNEEKGYYIISLNRSHGNLLKIQDVKFCKLPTRPMRQAKVDIHDYSPEQWKHYLGRIKDKYPFDVVLRLNIEGNVPDKLAPFMKNAFIRQMTPSSMNIKLKWRNE